MNYLDKLLQGKEVEWKTLGEVAEKISSGGTPKTGTPEYYDGDIPWLRTQEVGIGDIWDTGVKITELGLKNSSAKMIPENCVIVAMYGATVGKVGINKIPLCTNQACANIQLNKEIAHYRYVYYFLLSQYEYIKSLGAGSQTNINAQIVKKLQIPIPFPNDPQKSLAIQQEIVRVLDSLSEQNKALTSALAQEIDNRNKQYAYYREELFRFEGKEVEWKKISEIGTFQRGKRFVRTDMTSEGVPCIHYGEMYTHYGTWAINAKSYLSKELVSSKKLRVAEKNDVVIVAAGETIEDIGKGTAWLGEKGVVIHDACFSYKSSLNPVYFAYFTRTILFHDQIRRNISSGKISAINEKGFNKVIIPVPSLAEQERIVQLLDRFDEATKNIVAALEKEIALRNKQYEYYRNQLLGFNG